MVVITIRFTTKETSRYKLVYFFTLLKKTLHISAY